MTHWDTTSTSKILRGMAALLRPGRTGLVMMLSALLATLGCQDIRRVLPNSTLHERLDWQAEKYFTDPQVIALCRAIEANDLREIDRLVAAGADVNARGKHMMTPLLWAFPDNKLDRFKRLLEHGADPNVLVESDFGTRFTIAGTSVTHMAAKTSFPGYFEAVFEHGGDPNLVQMTTVGHGNTPLFELIMSGSTKKKEQIQLLIDKGADLNHVNASGMTPTTKAFGWFGQYDIALMLLDAGADYRIYHWKGNTRLVHDLVATQQNPIATARWTPKQRADFQKLVDWLEAHGESLEQARLDYARWRSLSVDSGERRHKMAEEVAARRLQEPPPPAEEYFSDPQVAGLCRAIDANDLTEIDRLIAAGADVNARGKANMTPLLWAFPAKWMLTDPPGKLATVKRLLKHGADPNVVIGYDSRMFGDELLAGDSVTHLAAETPFPGYFEAVFEHGGNPNLPKTVIRTVVGTPIFTVIHGKAPNKIKRIQLLLDKGADINYRNQLGRTAAMDDVNDPEIVLMLLESGTNFRFEYPKSGKRLIHHLLEREQSFSKMPKQMAVYSKVINWLREHGESPAAALDDLNRMEKQSRKKH